MRKKIGQLHAAVAVRRELAVAAEQNGRFFLDEREADALRHRFRQLLAVQLVQLRLRIKQVDMARRAFRQKENAILRLRGKMRQLGREWIDRSIRRRIGSEQAILLQQRRQRQGAEARGARGEELPTSKIN